MHAAQSQQKELRSLFPLLPLVQALACCRSGSAAVVSFYGYVTLSLWHLLCGGAHCFKLSSCSFSLDIRIGVFYSLEICKKLGLILYAKYSNRSFDPRPFAHFILLQIGPYDVPRVSLQLLAKMFLYLLFYMAESDPSLQPTQQRLSWHDCSLLSPRTVSELVRFDDLLTQKCTKT